MAHETEAACLLRSGTLYSRRIGLKDRSGRLVFIGLKAGAFSVYLEDQPYFHFDLDGRWQRAFLDDTHYLRSLDGSVRAIDRTREERQLSLERRELSRQETASLDERILLITRQLREEVENKTLESLNPPEPIVPLSPFEVGGLLDRVMGWDAAAWDLQRTAFHGLYDPLPFIPPDCQNMAVLQATRGSEGPLRITGDPAGLLDIHSPESFRKHAEAVRQFLGKRLAQYRGLFLSGADADFQPRDRLLDYLRVAAEVFGLESVPSPPRNSQRSLELVHISSIDLLIDDCRASLADVESWTELRLRHHLGRVHLIAGLGGDSAQDRLVDVIGVLKRALVPVSLMIRVGVGNDEMASEHVDSAVSYLEGLPIGQGDLIQILDARGLGDPLTQGVLAPLDDARTVAQVDAFRKRLAPFSRRTGAKVASFSTSRAWY